MTKIKGVKTVDFKIEASGHGAVNWHGSVPVQGPDGKEVNNHSIPKLRGFSNKTGLMNDEKTYAYKIKADDINLKKTPVYVSPECVKFNLFKEESFNISTATAAEDAKILIPSIVGLLKGYVIAQGGVSIGKKSPVLMESLVEILGNGNYEQFSKFGSKQNDTSLFSKTTLGDTQYVGYGSLVIEDLFFPLDDIFGRKACEVPSVAEGEELAAKLTEFLKTLDFDEKKDPKATYKECYVRNGSLMKTGEAGIVMNDDAIDLVVDYLIEKLRSLHIRQGRGWLAVDKVTIDYNDSKKPMRIKKDVLSASEERKDAYAQYFIEGDAKSKEESKKTKEVQSGKKEKVSADKKKKESK